MPSSRVSTTCSSAWPPPPSLSRIDEDGLLKAIATVLAFLSREFLPGLGLFSGDLTLESPSSRLSSARPRRQMTPLLAAFGVVLNSPALRPAALRPVLLTPLAAPRHAAVVALEAPDNPYRVLGVTEDATYDEIMDAHIELTEACGGDEACVARFDSAKEKILDDRLRARMSGSLGAAAGVEQVAAAFDRPPPKRTMPWVYIPRIARKVFAMPTKKWAIQVVGLLGGLTFAAWCSPSSVGSVLLLNTLSCAGWMYNRGTPDVVRDDQGQIGEVRPMKLKPAIMAFGLTACMWFAGNNAATKMVASGAIDPKLRTLMRTTIISMYYIVGTLFIQCHDVFERGALGPPRD